MTDQRKRIVIVIVGANFAGRNAAIKLSRHPSSRGEMVASWRHDRSRHNDCSSHE